MLDFIYKIFLLFFDSFQKIDDFSFFQNQSFSFNFNFFSFLKNFFKKIFFFEKIFPENSQENLKEDLVEENLEENSQEKLDSCELIGCDDEDLEVSESKAFELMKALDYLDFPETKTFETKALEFKAEDPEIETKALEFKAEDPEIEAKVEDEEKKFHGYTKEDLELLEYSVDSLMAMTVLKDREINSLYFEDSELILKYFHGNEELFKKIYPNLYRFRAFYIDFNYSIEEFAPPMDANGAEEEKYMESEVLIEYFYKDFENFDAYSSESFPDFIRKKVRLEIKGFKDLNFKTLQFLEFKEEEQKILNKIIIEELEGEKLERIVGKYDLIKRPLKKVEDSSSFQLKVFSDREKVGKEDFDSFPLEKKFKKMPLHKAELAMLEEKK